jgi:hypothetical protein
MGGIVPSAMHEATGSPSGYLEGSALFQSNGAEANEGATVTSFSLDDVKNIAGKHWNDNMHTRFMTIAEPSERVGPDGNVSYEYRADISRLRGEYERFVKFEEELAMKQQINSSKHTVASIKPSNGRTNCHFTLEEAAACKDDFCQCADAEALCREFGSSNVALTLQHELYKIPSYGNPGDLIDPSVYLFAENPISIVQRICKEFDTYFVDMNFPPGAALCGPSKGTHNGKPYDFSGLKYFARFSSLSPRPTNMFDSSSRPLNETVTQQNLSSEFVASLEALASLCNGDLLRSIIKPSKELNHYGVYSFKIHLPLINPRKNNAIEPVDAWVLLDDFIPCDEGGFPLFATCAHTLSSAWPCIFEKLAAKLFGKSRGGYRELVQRSDYCYTFIRIVTGLEMKPVDIKKPKEWSRLHKQMIGGVDSRVAALATYKRDITKEKSLGVRSGNFGTCISVVKLTELPTKYKNPHRLVLLRNSCTCFIASYVVCVQKGPIFDFYLSTVFL